jgi:hypothetical protein
MRAMRLLREERVVRAICTDKYDRANGRVSPSLFKGAKTSVSRLAIIPLEQQWRRLAATVQKLPGRRLERLGEIGVGNLEDLGRTYIANGTPMSVSLSVIADPNPVNVAHAVIPENISAGLGNTIVRALIYHELPVGFHPEQIERIA